MQSTFDGLEAQLNNFDAGVRAAALEQVAALAAQQDGILEAEKPVANLHCHTFFSFNAYGYSPTGLAWLAKRRGYRLLGMIDFDVLDGVDEFMTACERIGVRGSAGIETRVYLPEFSTRETNSPGEPGIFYHIGVGFTSSRAPDDVQPILAGLRQRAQQRNQGVIQRMNDYLAPVQIDYAADVLPLTPGNNPTERHIVVGYIRAAERMLPDAASFWSDKLGMAREQVERLMQDFGSFQNTIRVRLIKKGGPGYVTPGPDSFPMIDDVNRLIVACGALPTLGWLDGTTNGEQSIRELIELIISKGGAALNIVPDRNWNISDPDAKRVKLDKLYEIVALAGEYDLPLNVGTEMNAFGQKLMDDFDAPELLPVRQAFLDGAHFVYGHTALQRRAGLGYQGAWAQAHLPGRKERNAFYMRAGYAITPGGSRLPANETMSPADILKQLNA